MFDIRNLVDVLVKYHVLTLDFKYELNFDRDVWHIYRDILEHYYFDFYQLPLGHSFQEYLSYKYGGNRTKSAIRIS